MKYHFDSAKGSFFLNDPNTGKVWENYVWNQTDKGFFITVINHYGGTYSWLLRDTAERVYVTSKDTPSCIYVRDDDNGDYWNPGVSPTCNEVEDFCCEHSLSFTEVSGKKNGISVSQKIAVIPDELAEVWKVTVKNDSDVKRNISVFAFSKLDLNGFDQSRFYYAANTGGTMFLEETETLFCQEINPFMPEDIFSGYVLSSEPVSAYEGRLEHFYGYPGGYAIPQVLKEGKDLGCTNAAVRDRGGILQNKITLDVGETKTLYYVLGFAPASKELMISRKAELVQKAKDAFEGLYERGIKQFGALRTNSPEERVNNIMNFWVQKQVSFCMLGKQAVRDNSQIVLGMLNYDAELAKLAVSDCIAHQYIDGHSQQTWGQGAREAEIYSDPSAWLILATVEYIKETGDMEFLKQMIPFEDHPGENVYKHLLLAGEWFMRDDNYGPNKLPRIHHADWNDALNIPDDTAESVFMAMMICYAFKELIALARYVGDNENADKFAAFRDELAKRTNETAWNGDYYVRAFSKFGVVGDKDSTNGGNIYINPQVWAILSEIVPEDRMEKLLASIDGMETECGVPLCDPPYQKYDESVGRMSAMPPGVYENGGIYNHACAFKVMADCKIGRGEHAVNTLMKMIPGGEANPCEITTTEPYVFTNCYLKHKNEDMVVGFSWQTGSSAWALRDYYEGVLGLVRNFEGLEISPNIPEKWDVVEAERPYRGSRLLIRIENCGGKNVELWVDGVLQETNIIPSFSDNAEHKILAKLV